MLYRIAADAVLLVHAMFVAFVVFGLLFTVLGAVRGWAWIRNPWFRLLHLAAIGIVVIQSWLHVLCPLTDIEMSLRLRAGEAVYAGSFVAHWLGELIYYQAPAWVFITAYTVFAAAVAATWVFIRPRPFARRGRH